MLRRYAASFYQLGSAIGTLQTYLMDDLVHVDLSNENKAGAVEVFLGSILPQVEEWSEDLALEFSLLSVKRLREPLSEDVPADRKLTARRREIVNLDERFRDELSNRVLFFVEPTRAKHYENFRAGWEDALARFPIANDVEEAEKCFALDRWTACVFHLMRIAEVGVQELGRHFGLSQETLQESWGNIINALDGPLKKIQDKADRAKYSLIKDDLFHVNFAWRIPTDHPKTPGSQYGEEQAAEALARTKALMQHLAVTL